MRKTKKLLAAAELLASETISDFYGSPGEFLAIAHRRRVTPAQIFKACESLGYRWTGKAWLRTLPRWLERIKNSERKLI